MYEFAILLGAGLITAKVVDLVRYFVKDLARAGVLVLAAVVGVGLAYLLDFSLFAAWGVAVRDAAIGTFATGLVIMGVAALWHELLGVMRNRRYHGDAAGTDSGLRRAA